ncbi:MAG TPA: hypothetical protein VGY97_05470 [Solirubrobacteraceae bacterium]|jgi:hypothetical protein|nr:hypothetical protein [Solirubrobacteraceae bacterium]
MPLSYHKYATPIQAAFRILEEAEADAVLAAAGDRTALTRLVKLAAGIEGLHEALDAEFPR